VIGIVLEAHLWRDVLKARLWRDGAGGRMPVRGLTGGGKNKRSIFMDVGMMLGFSGIPAARTEAGVQSLAGVFRAMEKP